MFNYIQRKRLQNLAINLKCTVLRGKPLTQVVLKTQPWHHAVVRSAPYSFAQSDRQHAVVYNQPLLLDQSEQKKIKAL